MVVVQGGIIQRKMFEGKKSRGQLPYGEFHGGNCQGRIFPVEKFGDGQLSLGRFHRVRFSGDSGPGGIIQG